MFFLSKSAGTAELAAYGLSNFVILFISMIFLSLNTTLLTLVSQSFGKGDVELCRTFINRGRVIVTLSYVPLALLISLFASKLLASLGLEHPSINTQASWTLRIFLGGLFLTLQYDITRLSLNAMGKSYLIVITLIISLILHPCWAYLYISHL